MVDKGKKPIYVEFIGLPGSGKTTICRALAKELKKNDIEVAIREEEFVKYGKIYRHTAPIYYAFKELGFRLFSFLFFISHGWEIDASLKSKFRSWKAPVTGLCSVCLVINKTRDRMILSEQWILHAAVFYKPSTDPKCFTKYFLKLYGKNTYFVYVKTPLSVIYGRLLQREEHQINEDKNALGSFLRKEGEYVLDYFKKVDKTLRELLVSIRNNGYTIIEVDGEKDINRSIDEIIKFIKINT